MLHGLSVLVLRIGDHEQSLSAAREAVAFFRTSSDRRALAEELHHLGTVTWVFSDYDGAERWCEESRAVAEDAGEAAIVASVIHTLGVIAASRNNTAAVGELIAHSIELLRALPSNGEPLLVPVARGYGRVPGIDGAVPRLFLEQTFVTARRVQAAGAVAYALCDLAALARDAGEVAASRALAEESLARFRQLGDELGAAQALAQLGNLLSAEGEHELARELHEESLAVREAATTPAGSACPCSRSRWPPPTARSQSVPLQPPSARSSLFDRTDDGPGRAAAVMQLGYLAADAGRPRERPRVAGTRARAVEGVRRPTPAGARRILLEFAAARRRARRAHERRRGSSRPSRSSTHIGDQPASRSAEAALRRNDKRGANARITPRP